MSRFAAMRVVLPNLGVVAPEGWPPAGATVGPTSQASPLTLSISVMETAAAVQNFDQ